MSNLNRKSGAIGYKRPPTHTRFAKGKSGNPKGRPKGARSGGKLASVVNQTVSVTVEGVTQKMPLTEALAMSLAQRALAGNIAAAREFMKIAEKVAAEQKAVQEQPSPVLFELVPLESKDCTINTALEKLDVFELDGPRRCIRPWVVEAALARNNQLRANDSDREIIAENMLNPEHLRMISSRAA
jgi:hypothetical protein